MEGYWQCQLLLCNRNGLCLLPDYIGCWECECYVEPWQKDQKVGCSYISLRSSKHYIGVQSDHTWDFWARQIHIAVGCSFFISTLQLNWICVFFHDESFCWWWPMECPFIGCVNTVYCYTRQLIPNHWILIFTRKMYTNVISLSVWSIIIYNVLGYILINPYMVC